MNADVHGRNAHADGMDTDAHEVDSGAHEVNSGDNEVDPDDDLPDLDACEEDYDDDNNDSDSDDLELGSDAHCVDGVSFISPVTVTEVASTEESSSPRSPRDKSNRKKSPRPPLRRLDINSGINKRTYRYDKRVKASAKAISKLEQKRDRLYHRSFENNPFESPRGCCNAACFHYVNPEYAVIQYRRFLEMSRCEKKRALTSMHDRTLRLFRFDGEEVCSRFLSAGFNFSFCLQSSVKATPEAHASSSIKACPRDIKTDTKKDGVIQFLRELANNIGDSMPTRSHTNLPLMDKTQIYQRYLQQFRKSGLAEPATKAYFHWVWKHYCSEIKARRHHEFTVCDNCEVLRSEMANCTDEETQAVLRAKMDAHYQLMHEERRGYTARRELAARSPGKYCSIIVDGADQKCYGLPHFVFKTKGELGHKLKVKCVGVLEHGPQKHLSLFSLTEEFESGANHVLEDVHRVLEEKKQKCGVLPEVLFVQADNCNRENKNRYFMGYFEMLVALGVFKEVQISFLPIGHTHADIDQAFSSVARRLRMNDAIHMEHLLQELRNCYNPRATAEEMTKVVNFSGLCDSSGCLVKVSSFSQYRYFRFTRKVSKTTSRGHSAPGSSRDHQMIANDQAFPTTCDVKFQDWEEWTPMDNSGGRKGFLRFVPNLVDTPPTDTIPPDNVLEINKHLRSVEARLKTAENLETLETMRDRVYTRHVDDLHWDLERAFEMHGDYKGAETKVQY